MRYKSPTAPKESDICKQFINEYKRLCLYNYFSCRTKVIKIANESLSTRNFINHLIAMGMCPGAADYLVIFQGNRIAFIEFKRTPKEKLRENQLAFKADVEDLDIPYLMTHDIHRAFQFIKELC